MAVFNKKQTKRRDGFGLNEREFSILGSLSLGPKHGYAVAKDIREATEGDIQFTAATLYETIAKLRELGFIERHRDETSDDGRPRKTYRITGAGEVAARDYLALVERTARGILAPQKGG